MTQGRNPLLYILLLIPAALYGQSAVWESLNPQSPFLLYSNADLEGFRNRVAQNERDRLLYEQISQQSAARSGDRTQRAKIAKSIAFVLAMGQDENGPLPTKKRLELDSVLSHYLREIDPEVQTNNSEYQWRAIELAQFSQAYDMKKGAGLPNAHTEALLAAFATESAAQLDISFQPYNNLSAKLAGGLGIAALTLKNAENPALRDKTGVWLSKALTFIERTFFEFQSGSDGNGGYSEGPYYLRYAMMSLLPFFTALDRATAGRDIEIGGTVFPNPLRDPRFQRVFDWIAYARMPDGRLPAFEDTYMYARFPELATLAALGPKNAFFAWPSFDGLNEMAPAAVFSHMSETYDYRIEYFCANAKEYPTPPGHPLIKHMPDAGYSVYRSSWEPDATYFAMIGKHGNARTGGSAFGSGHKHANEGAFILFSGGELLALEPGYYQYDYRDSLIYGLNHNIILVDGKGPDATSILNNIIGVDAYIEDTLSGQWGGTSTVRTRYEDTDIARTAVFFNGNAVILRDAASSTGAHEFTHQIHGNGLPASGTFVPDYANGSAEWQSRGMKLHANVGALGQTPSYTTAIRKHAPAYRVFEEHAAMYSSVQGSTAVFHTMLIPVDASEDVSFATLSTPPGVYAVSAISEGNVIVSATNTTGSIYKVESALGSAETDAALSAVGSDGATGIGLYLERATVFSLAGLDLLRTDRPATVIGRIGRETIELTASGSELRELSLFLSYQPGTVTGSGFSSYALEGNRLRIAIPEGRADIQIRLTNVPVSTMPLTTPDVWQAHAAYPNPAAGTITVLISIPAPGTVRIALYTTLGEEVYRTERNISAPGDAAITLTHPPHLRGIYLMTVELHGQVFTQRIVLQ